MRLDLTQMTVEELKDYANELGVNVHHKTKNKEKIIAMIEDAQKPEVVEENLEEVNEQLEENQEQESLEENEETEQDCEKVEDYKTELEKLDAEIIELDKLLKAKKIERQELYEATKASIKKPTLQELIAISRAEMEESQSNKDALRVAKKKELAKMKRRKQNAEVMAGA
jgi:hypothetical protein